MSLPRLRTGRRAARHRQLRAILYATMATAGMSHDCYKQSGHLVACAVDWKTPCLLHPAITKTLSCLQTSKARPWHNRPSRRCPLRKSSTAQHRANGWAARSCTRPGPSSLHPSCPRCHLRSWSACMLGGSNRRRKLPSGLSRKHYRRLYMRPLHTNIE